MFLGVNKRLAAFFTLCICIQAHAANSINGIRVWPAPESTRVVFDLSKKPDYKYFSLSSPQRLVIDFNDSKSLISFQNIIKNDRRIKKIRKSKPKNKNSTRVVLELADNYQLTVFPLAPIGQYGNRLVIDLYDKNRVSKAVNNINADSKRDIVIAIVAGHGGDDPGSIGAKGSYEKRITLQIAKKLAKLINNHPGMKAVMIRQGDYYITHDRKPKLARKNKADLLISIHADAFTSPKPSGASVLVQSTRRANSEFARLIANRQKESELLGGAGETIKKTKDTNLAITLADMKKEHTMKSSYEFATHVLKQLKKITRLHKKKPEGLSLAVLKAPDIPSVLIETGFISNPNDEKKLNSSAHQQKLAKAIYTAIDSYFNHNPPEDSLLAANSMIEHEITRGESLSVVAHRYKVSVGHLKRVNNLTSNTIRIGQTLKIPRTK
ncbi:N-acetylmuramoyl-L-alanine amidase [Thalassomonas viridans]|uniref:N-acetylmuramoyl-L-alanine amidase AmiC n=1 Tax=Thalassomonas viridans TaxID=137584 RepID=A0AAE9Z9Y2_9GAMM|nr:N-acetylmuramoyl-L-alanine amidase [Thalassomonas viridans]WDE09228.1 N-acetylmuramoyl-L-alanine amidase [Thalassomonas viridans]